MTICTSIHVRTETARLTADVTEALIERLREELVATRRFGAFLDAAIERNSGGK